MIRGKLQHLGGVAAAACLLMLILGVVAAADTGLQLEARIDSSFAPQALPARSQVPVRHRISIDFSRRDEQQLPPLQELELQEDRDVHVHLHGLPVCPTGEIEFPGRETRAEVCRRAQIGSGQITAIVSFPEQLPKLAHGVVRAYNARGHRPTILIEATLGKPVSGEIPIILAGRRLVGGRYGMSFSGPVPRIAGSGAITHLAVHFRKGIFSAACPADGQLRTKLDAAFGDGSELTAVSLTGCA
jgi:hypothetical protein